MFNRPQILGTQKHKFIAEESEKCTTSFSLFQCVLWSIYLVNDHQYEPFWSVLASGIHSAGSLTVKY